MDGAIEEYLAILGKIGVANFIKIYCQAPPGASAEVIKVASNLRTGLIEFQAILNTKNKYERNQE